MRQLFPYVMAVLLAGCAGVPRISAIHDPLYRAQDHTSTIDVRATETRDGVASIRIDGVIGELTACSGSPGVIPSIIPCRRAATTFSAVCTYANVKTQVSCALPIRSTARRLVTTLYSWRRLFTTSLSEPHDEPQASSANKTVWLAKRH